jgi:hypothetical protein
MARWGHWLTRKVEMTPEIFGSAKIQFRIKEPELFCLVIYLFIGCQNTISVTQTLLASNDRMIMNKIISLSVGFLTMPFQYRYFIVL